MLKPSCLKRRCGLLNMYNYSKPIINFIKQNDFEIIAKKEINITTTDIMKLYRDDFNSIKKEKPDDAKFMFQEYKKILQAGPSLLILVKYKNENALEEGYKFKGAHFLPQKCAKNTIRYKFRQKVWDTIKVKKGVLIELPDDNVCHAPRTENEFLPIIKKYMKKEWNKITSQ